MLVIITVGLAVQNITKKTYNVKDGTGPITFSLISVTAGPLCFFFMPGLDLSQSIKVIPYAFAFSVFFVMATLFSLLAIKEGSLSLTALVTAYSLLIPTFFGIFAFDEGFGPFKIIGILVLGVSLFCINFKKSNGPKNISFKWLVFVILAFIGNGMCSTVQKYQQVVSGGSYKAEFMIVSYTISALLLLPFVLFKERKEFLPAVKSGLWLGALCGVGNALVNIFVLILTDRMDSSVMFPLISAGSILATVIIAIILYKEKLSNMQKLGIGFGLVSIVLLNI